MQIQPPAFVGQNVYFGTQRLVVCPPNHRAHVLVATPSYDGKVITGYLDSLLLLARACEDAGVALSTLRIDGWSLISKARDICAARLLADPSASHLLFVDGDQAFNAADVLAMLALDVDVCAATVPGKGIDWHLVRAAIAGGVNDEGLERYAGTILTVAAWSPPEQLDDGRALRVHTAGTGMMLIRRAVFEKIREATPELAYKDMERGSTLHGFFLPTIADWRAYPEDFSFCHRATKVGAKIWLRICDVEHTGHFVFRTPPEPLLECAREHARQHAAKPAA